MTERIDRGSLAEVFVVKCEKCEKVTPLAAYSKVGAINEILMLGFIQALGKYICKECSQKSG